MNRLEQLLKEVSELYIGEADLYMVDGLIPRELNELIYYVKKHYDNKYHRLLEKIKSPFGYWDRYSMIYDSFDNLNFDDTDNFHLIDYKTGSECSYNLPTRADSETLNNLLSKTIEILKYVREVKIYFDHTINANTERNE